MIVGLEVCDPAADSCDPGTCSPSASRVSKPDSRAWSKPRADQKRRRAAIPVRRPPATRIPILRERWGRCGSSWLG